MLVGNFLPHFKGNQPGRKSQPVKSHQTSVPQGDRITFGAAEQETMKAAYTQALAPYGLAPWTNRSMIGFVTPTNKLRELNARLLDNFPELTQAGPKGFIAGQKLCSMLQMDDHETFEEINEVMESYDLSEILEMLQNGELLKEMKLEHVLSMTELIDLLQPKLNAWLDIGNDLEVKKKLGVELKRVALNEILDEVVQKTFGDLYIADPEKGVSPLTANLLFIKCVMGIDIFKLKDINAAGKRLLVTELNRVAQGQPARTLSLAHASRLLRSTPEEIRTDIKQKYGLDYDPARNSGQVSESLIRNEIVQTVFGLDFNGSSLDCPADYLDRLDELLSLDKMQLASALKGRYSLSSINEVAQANNISPREIESRLYQKFQAKPVAGPDGPVVAKEFLDPIVKQINDEAAKVVLARQRAEIANITVNQVVEAHSKAMQAGSDALQAADEVEGHLLSVRQLKLQADAATQLAVVEEAARKAQGLITQARQKTAAIAEAKEQARQSAEVTRMKADHAEKYADGELMRKKVQDIQPLVAQAAIATRNAEGANAEAKQNLLLLIEEADSISTRLGSLGQHQGALDEILDRIGQNQAEVLALRDNLQRISDKLASERKLNKLEELEKENGLAGAELVHLKKARIDADDDIATFLKQEGLLEDVREQARQGREILKQNSLLLLEADTLKNENGERIEQVIQELTAPPTQKLPRTTMTEMQILPPGGLTQVKVPERPPAGKTGTTPQVTVAPAPQETAVQAAPQTAPAEEVVTTPTSKPPKKKKGHRGLVLAAAVLAVGGAVGAHAQGADSQILNQLKGSSISIGDPAELPGMNKSDPPDKSTVDAATTTTAWKTAFHDRLKDPLPGFLQGEIQGEADAANIYPFSLAELNGTLQDGEKQGDYASLIAFQYAIHAAPSSKYAVYLERLDPQAKTVDQKFAASRHRFIRALDAKNGNDVEAIQQFYSDGSAAIPNLSADQQKVVQDSKKDFVAFYQAQKEKVSAWLAGQLVADLQASKDNQSNGIADSLLVIKSAFPEGSVTPVAASADVTKLHGPSFNSLVKAGIEGATFENTTLKYPDVQNPYFLSSALSARVMLSKDGTEITPDEAHKTVHELNGILQKLQPDQRNLANALSAYADIHKKEMDEDQFVPLTNLLLQKLNTTFSQSVDLNKTLSAIK